IAQELLECLVVAVEKKGELSELEGSSGARTEINDTKTPARTSGSMKLRSRKRKLGEYAEDTKPEPKIPEFDPSKLETYSVVRLFFAMNNLLPVSQRYKYMPKYQPSLFPLSLTEDCLLGITGIRDSRLWFKDFLDPKKDGPLMKRDRTGYKKYRKYRLIGQKDLGERFVLNTSFETDGFSLSIHVIDTNKKYRKYRTIGQKDSGERLVLMTSFATDGFSLSVNVIDTRCRKVKHTPPPPVVSRDLAYRKDKDIIMGMDLGQAFTVGAVSWLPNGSKNNLAVKKKALGEPYTLYRNWLNKTKMKDENKPDFLDPKKDGPLMKRDRTGELLQLIFGLKSKKYRKYRLIGRKDLVYQFTLSIQTVSWLPNGSKNNLAVKKKALGEPYTLYRNWLNKTKMKDENKPVRDAENCGLSRNSDETITIYFNRMMKRYSVLANFFNSHAIRKRTFEYHCAKQREMDRVFNALISMVGLKPHQKVKKKQRIYVGIGTGDFDATGSLHTSFLEYFVRKARPLGITILGVDEYFTSQKCVRCHEFTESLDRAYIKGKDIIMGLDMGQAYTVVAVSWLPDGSKKNLAVNKKALGEPYYLHRNWLNKTKMKDENKPVRDAENCGLSRNSDETITIYFNRMMERYSVLANFYNSHAIRKRTFEYHCAKQREMDRVFNALISMVGLKPHQKVKKKQRIYVGIGTGDFDATGSLHTSFLEYFVRKARPLGITILGVDEYFTSQKCVRCHEFTESLSMRAKKCSKCNVVFHRDILAADNMCAALSAILEKGERPEYLCKPPDDKSDDDNNDGGQDDGLNKKDRNGRNPKEKKKKKPKDKESGQSTSSEYALENAAKKKSASYVLGSVRVIVQ
ncbi:hypothetical protein MP638_001650, partial [Amoeboaphelidium occidentale]